jgi:hypothetical protein
MNYVQLLAENDKNLAKIEALEAQLQPANIQQFLTFAAIDGMSTKQINEVFTDLHESNVNAMAKDKAQQERITKLEADLKRYEHFTCKTCGGAGSVGNAPDDYYDCPECVQPFNEIERKLKAQDAEIIKLVDRLQSCEDDNGLLIEACELISSVIAKHSYRNEDGANIVNILDIEPQCQLIDSVLEATKQVKAVQHD